MSIRPSIHLSMRLLYKGSEGQPEVSEGLPEESKGLPEGSEGLLEGSEALPEGSEGLSEWCQCLLEASYGQRFPCPASLML